MACTGPCHDVWPCQDCAQVAPLTCMLTGRGVGGLVGGFVGVSTWTRAWVVVFSAHRPGIEDDDATKRILALESISFDFEDSEVLEHGPGSSTGKAALAEKVKEKLEVATGGSCMA